VVSLRERLPPCRANSQCRLIEEVTRHARDDRFSRRPCFGVAVVQCAFTDALIFKASRSPAKLYRPDSQIAVNMRVTAE
jgi:hypothetical protein